MVGVKGLGERMTLWLGWSDLEAVWPCGWSQGTGRQDSLVIRNWEMAWLCCMLLGIQ